MATPETGPGNGAELNRRFTSLEDWIDSRAHSLLDRLPASGLSGALVEFLVFGLKQAWACIFGGALLALIMVTRLWYPDFMPIARYDFLFLAALAIQAGMILSGMEKLSEARVILIFHLVGTAMEIFKTSAGSWTYPEDSLFHIGAVPLFSGFMYASVGSYLARITRLFDMRYSRYPPLWATLLLAAAIYVNFFSHHYLPDMRIGLFVLTAVLFLRCQVHFRVFRFHHRMPLLLGFLLVAFFIWLAENIATFSGAWLYPHQYGGWTAVSPAKLGAWYLLMIISFVLVTLVHRPQPPDAKTRPSLTGSDKD
ncbi:MAG: DUF817 domain-containing protein [Nitratireductor sp.]